MKILKIIGGILLFIGVIGIIASKGQNGGKKSESIMYGIVFSIVGGAILAIAKSDEKE